MLCAVPAISNLIRMLLSIPIPAGSDFNHLTCSFGYFATNCNMYILATLSVIFFVISLPFIYFTDEVKLS